MRQASDGRADSVMDLRKLVGSLSVAVAAQLVAVVMSVLMTFLVPKVLDVREFAYWQLFIFYSSYVGILTLGINDGVYLVTGGMSRETVDKRGIGSQFYLLSGLQVLFATLAIIVCRLVVIDPGRSDVLFATAVYLFCFNLMGFLGYLFQALDETKLYSFAVIISRGSFLVPLVVLLVHRNESAKVYMACYVAAQLLGLIFCLVKGREFLLVKPMPFGAAMSSAVTSARVGVKLVIANVSSLLILGAMRFIVDKKWGIEAFGEVSFALSLVLFVISFVMQISMVLFPALRRIDHGALMRAFRGLRIALTLLLPFAYLAYFPLRRLVAVWLPQYEAAVWYLGILLPICVFDSRMSLLGSTFLKVLRFERVLLAINVVSMVVSIIGVLVAARVFDSITLTVLAPVVVIVGRSIVAEVMIGRYLGSVAWASAAGDVGLTIVFLGLSLFVGGRAGFVIYGALILAVIVAFRAKVRTGLRMFKELRRR